MTVARMWESRLDPARAGEFAAALAADVWPAVRAAPGFVGGEAYRSGGDEPRAVLVTRWVDATSARAALEAEARLTAYCAREPHAWEFEQLDV